MIVTNFTRDITGQVQAFTIEFEDGRKLFLSQPDDHSLRISNITNPDEDSGLMLETDSYGSIILIPEG